MGKVCQKHCLRYVNLYGNLSCDHQRNINPARCEDFIPRNGKIAREQKYRKALEAIVENLANTPQYDQVKLALRIARRALEDE